MKKKIALLILMALALTVVLSACGKTAKTDIIPRWSLEGETYEYTVTLSDFASKNNASSRFNSYILNDETYYKDFLVRTGEVFDNLDEIRPVEVVGKFTLTIKHLPDDKHDKVETHQELAVSYELQEGKIKVSDTRLVELTSEMNAIGVKDGDRITFKSTTDTMVEFKRYDNGSQTPIRSSTKLVGFYMGKTHQEVSDYEISTEYKYEGKSAVADITLKTGGKTETNSYPIKGYTEGRFIDSNQLFTYTRSLDKSSASFQDNPSVYVYNPFNQQIQLASFAYTSKANALLTQKDEQTNTETPLYIKLPTVGVVVGGMSFMLVENAPNMLDEHNEGPDRTQYGTEWYAKHTPVRFRSGYLSFELNYNVGTPQTDSLWASLNTYTHSED